MTAAKPFCWPCSRHCRQAAGRRFELYGQRWNIETDLRTLKSTLCLDQLTCSTPDMVAKEIDMGIAAYNLVRAMIAFASQQSGIATPRLQFHQGAPHPRNLRSRTGQCAEQGKRPNASSTK